MDVNWTPEDVFDYIFVPLHQQLEPILDRLATIEVKMRQFDEMQEKLRQLGEIEEKLQRLEAVEARMTQVESSLQKALGTFFPRVERLLVEIEERNSTPQTTSGAEEKIPKTLLDAAKVGDADSIVRLLATGTDVNQCDINDETALHHAARGGHVKAVRVLLNKGASVDVINSPDEYCPLILAAQAGHTEVVELLLGYGASVDAEDYDGSSVLWHAASAGQTSVVELLISKGADIDFGEEYESPFTTVLEIAAIKGHSAIVKALLSQSSKWSVSDLERALAVTNSSEVVWLIARTSPHDFWGDMGARAVMNASRKGNIDGLDALLRAGASPLHRNMNGLTPLHFAASHENLPCLLTLVVNGADIEARDNKGRTPLHLAAIHAKENAVRALMAKKADTNAVDKRGRTPADATDDPEIQDILSRA